MSAENEATVRGWFAAGDAGNLDDFDRFLHRDVVVHAPLDFSTSGIDSEKEVWRSVLKGVPDILHSVQEVLSSGSTVAMRTLVTGTHTGEFAGLSGTGRTFRINQAVFARLSDGKVVEAWEIADSGELFKQLGGETLA